MHIHIDAKAESGDRVRVVGTGLSGYERETLLNFQEVVRSALNEVCRSSVCRQNDGGVVINLEINYAVGGGAKVVLGNDYPEKG